MPVFPPDDLFCIFLLCLLDMVSFIQFLLLFMSRFTIVSYCFFPFCPLTDFWIMDLICLKGPLFCRSRYLFGKPPAVGVNWIRYDWSPWRLVSRVTSHRLCGGLFLFCYMRFWLLHARFSYLNWIYFGFYNLKCVIVRMWTSLFYIRPQIALGYNSLYFCKISLGILIFLTPLAASTFSK